MRPSNPDTHTPAPGDRTDHYHCPSPDLIEQLEAIRAAIAEAEVLLAEFAVQKYMEAKQLSKEVGR